MCSPFCGRAAAVGGDPLDRDADAVWADFRNGVISAQATRDLYGVVGTEAGVDYEQTRALRLQIHRERIGKKPVISDDAQKSFTGMMLGPSLLLVHTDQEWQIQSRAGYVLARNTTAWRTGAIARSVIIDDYPGQLKLHENLMMTAFYCPASGILLAVDVHEKNTFPIDDILLDLHSLVQVEP